MVRSLLVIGSLVLTGGWNLMNAQHGGGHGAGHGAAQGAAHGHPSQGVHLYGPQPGMSTSTLSGFSPVPGLTYPTPIGLQPQFSGFTGINRGALPVNGGRRGDGDRRRGDYRNGFPGLLYPYVLSTFDDAPYGYGDYQSAGYQGMSADSQGMQNGEAAANALGDQIAQLSAEVDALRNERGAPGYGPVPTGPMPYGQAPVPYASAPPAAYQAPPQAPEEPAGPPITLVLHDGKKVVLENYAVMGKSIWNFSNHPAKRIALSTVDIAASKTATEASGAEFPEIR